MMAIPPGARSAPSTQRNRDAILLVLKPRLPAEGLVLEIAAGAGEHAVHCARALPGLTWQPTDPDEQSRASIDAWRMGSGLANLRPALALDAADPDHWPVDHADAVICINMIHISPWAATQGLLTGAGRILPPGGLLYLYGPYKEGGEHPAPTNALFDADLKARNPSWGLRDLETVTELAAECGLDRQEIIRMPANNLSLIFRHR